MLSNHPDIDVTEAAKAYGIPADQVPEIAWDLDERYGEPDIAAYCYFDDTIHCGSLLLGRLTDRYDESRFRHAGAGHLDQEDAVRFVIAHELWHAHQWAEDPAAMLRSARHAHESEAAHDSDWAEIEADQHAATAYPLVKVNGKGGAPTSAWRASAPPTRLPFDSRRALGLGL